MNVKAYFPGRPGAVTTSKHFVPMVDKIRSNMSVVKNTQHRIFVEDTPRPVVEITPRPMVEDTLRKKIKIPNKVRIDVWATYIGEDIAKHKCICCKRVTIRQTEFEVGHVLSEAHGGTLEINNLRPICSVCNKSMGARNMVEFVKEYGYYI